MRIRTLLRNFATFVGQFDAIGALSIRIFDGYIVVALGFFDDVLQVAPADIHEVDQLALRSAIVGKQCV
ncbi:serine/threonine protein kinase [Eggerthella sp. YY7918]|nr:serine/threonine protein kinase [Eggerthella sp. YY7918]